MNVLLHICCGPCAIYPVEVLRQAGYDVEGFFYNPNIHPYSEYLRRKEALEKVSEYLKLHVYYHDYDFEYFLNKMLACQTRSSAHCFCWNRRLEETAKYALKQGLKNYTTTLLVSPYQDVALIRDLGQKAGIQEGVNFLSMDFRQGFAHSHKVSKELGIYHQNYCGCLISEKEAILQRKAKKQKLQKNTQDFMKR
ncbi:MAG: epoxyqueuosine reductase QueH [Candidatus Omnitrophota bacterium]